MLKNTAAGICLLAQIDAAILTAPSVNDAKLLANRPRYGRAQKGEFYGWNKPTPQDLERIGWIAFASQDTRYKVLLLKERLVAFRRAIDLAHRVQPKSRNKPYKPHYPPMPEPERKGILYAMAEPELQEAA